jgi:hypothetical protein
MMCEVARTLAKKCTSRSLVLFRFHPYNSTRPTNPKICKCSKTTVHNHITNGLYLHGLLLMCRLLFLVS